MKKYSNNPTQELEDLQKIQEMKMELYQKEIEFMKKHHPDFYDRMIEENGKPHPFHTMSQLMMFGQTGIFLLNKQINEEKKK